MKLEKLRRGAVNGDLNHKELKHLFERMTKAEKALTRIGQIATTSSSNEANAISGEITDYFLEVNG